MLFIEIIKAILLGIVEGITEWLPVSSTGHMIILDELISLKVTEEFLELFLVVVQLGAIAAVPVYFFNRLNPFSKKKSEIERKATWSLWFKVFVGVLPAAVIGVLLDDFLDDHLYNYIVVSIALIVYGVVFVLIEKLRKNKAENGLCERYRVEKIEDLSYTDALRIGAFQMLSLVPGTSRSGSTIIGGMLTGVSRTVSAEFSFFMAIPVMIGASLLKIYKFIDGGFSVSNTELLLLFVGILVSFIVSLFIIKFLMDFVKNHTFAPFGIYRIALGVMVLLFFLIRN
ncbi:MAG: undecaprenyl-diphosphate phosphatase [Clostridia bacterium]|nr:undecaprenyl-diphosphate phosphatase [Clostridia bacterium]